MTTKRVKIKPKAKRAERAPKATRAQAKKSPKTKRLSRADVDQFLLQLTAKPYQRIRKQIRLGKKLLNEDRRIVFQLGERILLKAKEVRNSLIKVARPRR